MDTRAARRTAEKAARNLIAQRAAVIGDLAVLLTERTRLSDDVAEAQAQARQRVAAAAAEANDVVAAASQRAHDAEQRYAHAYNAATEAGWTAKDLSVLGYGPGRFDKPRRRSTRHLNKAGVASGSTEADQRMQSQRPDPDVADAALAS